MWTYFQLNNLVHGQQQGRSRIHLMSRKSTGGISSPGTFEWALKCILSHYVCVLWIESIGSHVCIFESQHSAGFMAVESLELGLYINVLFIVVIILYDYCRVSC